MGHLSLMQSIPMKDIDIDIPISSYHIIINIDNERLVPGVFFHVLCPAHVALAYLFLTV